MVHAENNEVINWISERLIQRGYNAPKFHAVSHSPVAESEASRRAIDLARLVDARMLIVHVSEAEAAHSILQARNNELTIYGETCPQYLFLTAKDLDQKGMEGAVLDIRKLKERYSCISVSDQGRAFNTALIFALELGCMLDCAEVIAASALERKDSRGAQSRRDYPQRDDKNWLKHILVHSSPKGPALSDLPVVITQWPPEERKY